MNGTISQQTCDDLRAVWQVLGMRGAGFDMRHWAEQTACGTTLCLAGHLALLRGYKPSWGTADVHLEGDRIATGSFGADKGDWDFIGNVIEEQVGIPQTIQHKLFWSMYWDAGRRERYALGDRVGAAQEAIERFIAKYGPQPEPVEPLVELGTVQA